jgi:hypothetical protein
MSQRIRDRAVERGGELLKQIKPKKGGDPKKLKGTLVPNSQAAVAKAAGISPDQAKQMLRVANVPKDKFEEAVEGSELLLGYSSLLQGSFHPRAMLSVGPGRSVQHPSPRIRPSAILIDIGTRSDSLLMASSPGVSGWTRCLRMCLGATLISVRLPYNQTGHGFRHWFFDRTS